MFFNSKTNEVSDVSFLQGLGMILLLRPITALYSKMFFSSFFRNLKGPLFPATGANF